MDKKTAGLLGAMAGIATLASANAALAQPLPSSAPAASYAELLAPISDPVTVLQADDIGRSQAASGEDGARLYRTQYEHHHHHHHHHRYHRRHHHHHHHHNAYHS